jgi:hypothetical protein
LKQNRKISIFLPDGYDAKDAKFPVLYVLDADGRDQHTVPTARFLSVNNRMPKAIVVGVFNIDRNHDFLPDSSQSAATGGGADNFLQIFKMELIPDLWITSDDGSKVYFYNELLFDNDGLHSADNPVVKVVPLNPGYYPVRIDYFERTGGESVTLGYVTGKKKIQPLPIPKEMLFYKE